MCKLYESVHPGITRWPFLISAYHIQGVLVLKEWRARLLSQLGYLASSSGWGKMPRTSVSCSECSQMCTLAPCSHTTTLFIHWPSSRLAIHSITSSFAPPALLLLLLLMNTIFSVCTKARMFLIFAKSQRFLPKMPKSDQFCFDEQLATRALTTARNLQEVSSAHFSAAWPSCTLQPAAAQRLQLVPKVGKLTLNLALLARCFPRAFSGARLMQANP